MIMQATCKPLSVIDLFECVSVFVCVCWCGGMGPERCVILVVSRGLYMCVSVDVSWAGISSLFYFVEMAQAGGGKWVVFATNFHFSA